MILMMIRIIISAPIVMVGGAFMAFTLNKRLSTVMFIAIPIILVIALVVAKQVLPMFDKAQKRPTDSISSCARSSAESELSARSTARNMRTRSSERRTTT